MFKRNMKACACMVGPAEKSFAKSDNVWVVDKPITVLVKQTRAALSKYFSL